jgi:hypothetical protein
MNKLKEERVIRNVHKCTEGLNMWGTLKNQDLQTERQHIGSYFKSGIP